jgi:hypothetical protein
MEKLEMPIVDQNIVFRNTHWVTLLVDVDETAASSHLSTGIALILLTVLLWPLPMLLSYPYFARKSDLYRGLREMFRGVHFKEPPAAYLPLYRRQRRAHVIVHCPLPPACLQILSGYVELTYNERMAFMANGEKGMDTDD